MTAHDPVHPWADQPELEITGQLHGSELHGWPPPEELAPELTDTAAEWDRHRLCGPERPEQW